MFRTKTRKSNYTGVKDSIGVMLKAVNKNPKSRQIIKEYQEAFREMKEDIFDSAIALEDSIIEEVQRRLIDNSDDLSLFISLARDNSEYVKLLGLEVLGYLDGELEGIHNSIPHRLTENAYEIELAYDEKIRNIDRLRLIPISVFKYYRNQYMRQKGNGLCLIKSMIQSEIYKVCEEYIGYTDSEMTEFIIKEEEQVTVDNTDCNTKQNTTFVDRSWKELNSIAEDNSFSLVRTKGDHGIFRHPSGNIVVIPQGRVIGKGLQLAIIKQINYNKL